MLFSALPWAERAQQEHDTFTQLLRDHGVEVLYLTELLQDALEYAPARAQAARAVLRDPSLGEELREQLAGYLDGLSPEALAQLLIMGLARDEFRGGLRRQSAAQPGVRPGLQRLDRRSRGGGEPAGADERGRAGRDRVRAPPDVRRHQASL
jgi:arginine deiminase